MKNKKIYLMMSVVAVSMYLQIENITSIMLSGISEAFPNASVVSVQKVYSLIWLVELFTNFVVVFIVRRLSKRKMIIVFQLMTVFGGLFAGFFGTTIFRLYISSVIIGFSAAVVSTVSKSLITENFAPEECPQIYSLQQISQSVGTVVLQVTAGILAAKYWRLGYLTFLFGLLSVLAAIFMLPEGEPERFAEGEKLKLWNKDLAHFVIITLAFIMIYTTYSANISYLISEKNLGNASIAGYQSSVMTAGNFAAALVFPVFMKKTKDNRLIYCFAVMFASYLFMAFAGSGFTLLIGLALAGLGQGAFTLTIYAIVAQKSQRSNLTASLAMINAAASCGKYIYPYFITAPTMLVSKLAASRYMTAAVLLVLLMIYEGIYCKKHENA